MLTKKNSKIYELTFKINAQTILFFFDQTKEKKLLHLGTAQSAMSS